MYVYLSSFVLGCHPMVSILVQVDMQKKKKKKKKAKFF